MMTAIPWMAGFLVTVGTVLAQKLGSLPPHHQYLIGAGTAVLLPYAMMADGGIDFFRKWKPALAELLQCAQRPPRWRRCTPRRHRKRQQVGTSACLRCLLRQPASRRPRPSPRSSTRNRLHGPVSAARSPPTRGTEAPAPRGRRSDWQIALAVIPTSGARRWGASGQGDGMWGCCGPLSQLRWNLVGCWRTGAANERGFYCQR